MYPALHGGGSLGAHKCGVCQTLAPWPKTNGLNLPVVCGTSIGAMNARVIAARQIRAWPRYVDGTMLLGEVTQVAAAFVVVQGACNGFTDNHAHLAEWAASANRVAFCWRWTRSIHPPDARAFEERNDWRRRSGVE